MNLANSRWKSGLITACSSQPTTLSIQAAAYSAGGQNGWHSHPGLVAVTMLSGTIQWYDEDCNPDSLQGWR
jgi:hypothetical protein